MTLPRGQLICPESTPYYHVISRCVRRAFLCGIDHYTQQSYEHRKPWVLDKLKQLASIFTIDVCAYAIMSNHYHLILHINLAENRNLSDAEVAARWQQLFAMPMLVDDWLMGKEQTGAEQAVVAELIAEWRSRLKNISWFMRCLNEDIARKANQEDSCKGHFWEGRFKSQALLDEKALLTCMTYVDLNPIRAKMCQRVKDQEFTSIYERVQQYKAKQNDKTVKSELLPFERQFDTRQPHEIPFYFEEYLQLVDWTGRAIRDDKRGYIPANQPNLLHELGIEQDSWLQLVSHFSRSFGSAAGSWEHLTAHSRNAGHCWTRGQMACNRLSGFG
ncbi:transposase [Motilimonas cestriensis]|uniref:Transposase n=1 Tax=Motilimonas cestriensis TaxID=2742685 RepID=A0ABS8WBK3_9GAMM|nr:transposase [Motilimonas cestriensis]MCE2596392.1 transposase [Motilimonas cestriensis]